MADTPLPRASGKGFEIIENVNVMVFGKKRAGKTTFVEQVLVKNKKRCLILDTRLHDYNDGEIFTDFERFKAAIGPRHEKGDFRYIVRCPGKEETVIRLLDVPTGAPRPLLINATVVVEEITDFTDSHNLAEALYRHLKYGGHFRNNLIGVARTPFEINRHLTRQTDIIVSFRQDEENDLAYFRAFDPEKTSKLPTLERGEYLVMRGADKDLLDFIKQP